MNVSNSTGLECSNSVRRPKSKDTKSKDRVLKNTNDKRPSTHVQNMSSSVSIDSNKCATINSTVCQSSASVLNTKTVNAVNDGLDIVCVSCGKDVFLLSHEKYVARYALSSVSKRVLEAYDWQSITTKKFVKKFMGAVQYYAPSTFEVTINSAANTLDVEDTPSSSSVNVEDSDASQIVTFSEEPITQESLILVLENHSDEQLQEDIAELDRNTITHSFNNPKIEEAKSSSNYQDPSNMHEFHQQHRYTDKWTKNYLIE
nr:hypothetical protein [Tanacetum cinerariifolium]